MEDPIQPFRSALMTATGIILGFSLNFAAGWVKTESPMSEWLAYVVGFSILLGTICLIYVMYLVLNKDYPKSEADSYYQKTLRFFMTGVCLSFLGAFIDMFANFWNQG